VVAVEIQISVGSHLYTLLAVFLHFFIYSIACH
jgi:hypothetical protein